MKRKGFTLIELLAVIIIIGVIALITTPVIIGVIGKTERQAFERSIDGLLETVRLDYSTDSFVSPREYYYEGKDLILLTVADETKDESVGMKGKIEGKGFIYIDGDGVIHIENICSKKYCANGEENKIEITENESGVIPEVGKNDPIIRLIGEKTIYVNLNEVYEELGAVAKTKSGKELEYTKEITISDTGEIVSNIDTSIENTYVITYKTENEGKEASVTRTVVVLDMKPVITMTDPDETAVTSKEVLITVSGIRPNQVTSFTYEIKVNGESIKTETITGRKETVLLERDGMNEVIVTVTDNNNHTNTMTKTYRIDAVTPTLTITTNSYRGQYGTDKALSSFYEATFGEMGGKVVCKNGADPITNVNKITQAGEYSIKCMAIGNNGKSSAEKTITMTITPKEFTEVMIGSDIATNDPGNNKRYVGANPNNYVWFNNEKWRIIGLFNGEAKIIKETSIGNKAWDTNNKNNWETATLKNELNGTYLAGIDITSRSYIDETHIWNLGGYSFFNATREQSYNYERGTNVYGENSETWFGSIGLLYPSDYAYASGAKDTVCDSTTLGGWYQTKIPNCVDTNWLYQSDYERWTLTHSTNAEVPGKAVFRIFKDGHVDYWGTTSTQAVYPVTYLKSTVKIMGGTGTSDDPYVLGYGLYNEDCNKVTKTVMGKEVNSCMLENDLDHHFRLLTKWYVQKEYTTFFIEISIILLIFIKMSEMMPLFEDFFHLQFAIFFKL